jgi:hypothetical protein
MRLKEGILSTFLVMISLGIMGQSLSRTVVSSISCSMQEDGYYLSNTVGEAVTKTWFGNFHFITQGFQQPSLINLLPPGTVEPLDAIDVYPNPVHDNLTVSFRIVELKTYYIRVIDAMGREIKKVKYMNLPSRDEKIDFSNYAQGLYFVHVYSDNLKMDRVFKIEKL